MSNEIKRIVDAANRYIDEGYSVDLYNWIDGIALKVFRGSQWTGGVWDRVMSICEGKDVRVPSRKYNCSRKYVYDGERITLTPCTVETCMQQVNEFGKIVDYKKVCELQD